MALRETFLEALISKPKRFAPVFLLDGSFQAIYVNSLESEGSQIFGGGEQLIQASIGKIKSNISKYINQASYGERIIILSRGKPKAVLMSIEELERIESTSFSTRQRNQQLLELLRNAPADDKGREWWAKFNEELADNRLSFREPE